MCCRAALVVVCSVVVVCCVVVVVEGIPVREAVFLCAIEQLLLQDLLVEDAKHMQTHTHTHTQQNYGAAAVSMAMATLPLAVCPRTNQPKHSSTTFVLINYFN